MKLVLIKLNGFLDDSSDRDLIIGTACRLFQSSCLLDRDLTKYIGPTKNQNTQEVKKNAI